MLRGIVAEPLSIHWNAGGVLSDDTVVGRMSGLRRLQGLSGACLHAGMVRSPCKPTDVNLALSFEVKDQSRRTRQPPGPKTGKAQKKVDFWAPYL
ncbi:MAG: hypothetical protein ACYCTV_07065 [Leptospirales bacterium]